MKATIRELVHATGGEFLLGNPHAVFHRISIDTRSLRLGDIFFALRGKRRDGHAFLTDAANKGAAGLVLESLDPHLELNPRRIPNVIRVRDTTAALQAFSVHLRQRANGLTVIGVTGTNGKTTAKEMIASILKRRAPVLVTRGNLNNHIGLPLMLTQLSDEARFAVLEMGASVPGDIALLCRIAQPHIGVITNVGKAHLQGLGSPEKVFQEKRVLFESLPTDGVAIVNLDDPFLKTTLPMLTCRRISFGFSPEAEVRAVSVEEWPPPLRFVLVMGADRRNVTLPILGRLNVVNALAAASTARALGVSIDDIVAGLEKFTPAPIRMEVTALRSGAVLVNDAYNANPTSMREALTAFCQTYPDREKMAVLGDMRELGLASAPEHRLLGEWMASLPLTGVFLYGRETRFILEGLQGKGFPSSRIERFLKKRHLIDRLKTAVQPRSAVLFKASRRLQLEEVAQAMARL